MLIMDLLLSAWIASTLGGKKNKHKDFGRRHILECNRRNKNPG